MVHELEYWYTKEPDPRQMANGPHKESVFPCEQYFKTRMNRGVKGGRRS